MSRGATPPLLVHRDRRLVIWARSPGRGLTELADGSALEQWIGQLPRSDIHMVASLENHPLLSLLESRGLSARVKLFRPQLDNNDEAKLVFNRIGLEPRRPASLGGPRWATELDCDVAAISTLVLHDQRLTEEETATMRRHPAWPALSFPPRGSLTCRAMLLSYISDPRWWVDPGRPDSPRRFYQTLDLSRHDAGKLRRALGSDTAARAEESVSGMLLHAWGAQHGAPNRRTGRDFLWDAAEPRDDEAPEDGLLRASRLYARLVRDVWLAGLYPGQELFVPEYFFESERAVVAWRRHVASLAGGDRRD